MKKVLLLVTIGSLLAVDVSLACSPPRYRTPTAQLNAMNSPLPLMKVSDNGQYLLKMMPTLWVMKNGFIEKRSAYGTVFKIRQNGDLQQLWTVKDLHPQAKNEYFMSPRYAIFIDDEGNTIKVVGSILKNARNPDVIWLYKQGKLLKTYSYSYFVKNTSKGLYNTCGTASWLDDYKTPLSFKASSLSFRSIDGLNWNIKLSTGEVTQLK